MSLAQLLVTARPYVETAKPGDRLDVVTCVSQRGWWTVTRNGTAIHPPRLQG